VNEISSNGGGFDVRMKVLVADDHRLMLAAVRMAFSEEADIEIVGEASAGQEVLPLVGRTSPDVVLLDLRMPGMDGLRCLELLRERHPSVKAIIFSASDDPAAVEAAFARGAVAFIQKSINPADLAAVVRQAVASNVFFAAGAAVSVEPVDRLWNLSVRETEILRALAEGPSNKQIARDLWLSDQTIKYHLTNIYRKLGVSSRTEAVVLAYERGVIENPVARAVA
jgi:DNA-binding NarL/FixJ family response regulator